MSLSLSDLADLVVVRNHINIVLNDKSATEKSDFRALNEARIKLDKKFVEGVKGLDFDNLVLPPTQYLTVKTPGLDLPHTSGYVHVESTKDILSIEKSESVISPKFSSDEIDLKSSPSGIWDEDPNQEDNDFKALSEVINPHYDHILYQDSAKAQEGVANDDSELFEARLMAQKEQLKKDCRSNKRKAKEDVSKE